jgi:hypothetical protein
MICSLKDGLGSPFIFTSNKDTHLIHLLSNPSCSKVLNKKLHSILPKAFPKFNSNNTSFYLLSIVHSKDSWARFLFNINDKSTNYKGNLIWLNDFQQIRLNSSGQHLCKNLIYTF